MFAHLSHMYQTGASIYVQFLFRVLPDPDEMLDLFLAGATQMNGAVVYRNADIVITLSNVDLDALTAANFTAADAFDPVVIPEFLDSF